MVPHVGGEATTDIKIDPIPVISRRRAFSLNSERTNTYTSTDQPMHLRSLMTEKWKREAN